MATVIEFQANALWEAAGALVVRVEAGDWTGARQNLRQVQSNAGKLLQRLTYLVEYQAEARAVAAVDRTLAGPAPSPELPGQQTLDGQPKARQAGKPRKPRAK